MLVRGMVFVLAAALLFCCSACGGSADAEFEPRILSEEEAKRWNQFVDDVCAREFSALSEVQKPAVLCFFYDAEMNSGGHSGYFDYYPETDHEELMAALTEIGGKAMADNYYKALTEGEEDDWVETDDVFYGFSPSLTYCLMDYVEEYKDVIFE